MTLESRIDKCCEDYSSIETAALHVTEQLPNEHTRVQSLLDSIDGCTDPKICSRIANINDDSNAMHDDWEAAVAYLLPVDPVAKRQNGSKRKIGNISSMDSGGMKVGTGANTGVELRYHKGNAYNNLIREDKNELCEWRESLGPDVKVPGDPN